MPFSYPRELRITTPREYRQSLYAPTRIHHKGLIGNARKNDLTHSRLGMVISKKEIPLAVRRNDIKRQIRESFRLNQNDIPYLDVVIVVKRPCRDLDRKQIRALIDTLWERLSNSCKVQQQKLFVATS